MAESALPQDVSQALDSFVASAKEAFGEDLVSLVLFGSAAEGRMRATSDVNLMIVLARFDPVKADRVRLSRGPRENLWRPAIDVLFRSAAVAHGSRVISVVLSGALDDGTAGTDAVKRCGGVTVAQSPADARVPAMPESVIRNGLVDHTCESSALAALIERLVAQTPATSPPAPARSSIRIFRSSFGSRGRSAICSSCSSAVRRARIGPRSSSASVRSL